MQYNSIEAMLSLAWKDLLRFWRQPFLIVVSVVMPLVFIFFYGIIVPTSSTNPVVIAMDGQGPEAQAFLMTLRGIQSQEGPYYEFVTTDSQTARTLFDSGRAFGLIVVPADFDQQVAAGKAQVELHLNNVNSDYSKNLRLRMDYAAREFNAALTGQGMQVSEITWLPHDPVMQDYISTSLLLFACLYSGMLNTGLQVAGEWDERTVKTLLLAPVRRSAVIAAKVLAGLIQSAFSIALVLLVLLVAFHFRPVGSYLALLGVMLAVSLFGASIGAAVGALSKQTLAVTSILIAVSILIFLVSGNEDSMRGLAWNGPIVALWQISRWLPTTYAFLAARSVLLTGDISNLGRDLTIVFSSTILIFGAAVVVLRRAYSQLPGGQ